MRIETITVMGGVGQIVFNMEIIKSENRSQYIWELETTLSTHNSF